MTFGDSVVDGLPIIRAVRGHRCNLSKNLIKQRRHFGDVTDIVRRQLRGNDFMRDGVNPEVQLAPSAARPYAVFLIEPFSLAVNLQTCAVDKKMQWLRTVKPLEQDCQATTATPEDRMIRDGDIDPEHVGDRMQKTFGLTQPLVEHQTKREAGLNGDRRIDWLATPLSCRRRRPCRHRLLGEPNRQASRRTSAASYSGQFVTRYLALGNLWRRPSVNLYGMSLHNQQRGTGGLSHGLAACPP